MFRSVLLAIDCPPLHLEISDIFSASPIIAVQV